ncbi:uncharacterized protein VTP21DRAFT_9732 [Calcarisporiella thermophila]|uniref:uncharacterized protein n=1 Tax=Calcarisporiella thermophila TaxID=911321 RepID=UPI0037424E7D
MSQCDQLKNIVEYMDQNDHKKYNRHLIRLIEALRDAEKIVNAFSNKGIVKLMLFNYTYKIDVVILRLNRYIQDLRLQLYLNPSLDIEYFTNPNNEKLNYESYDALVERAASYIEQLKTEIVCGRVEESLLDYDSVHLLGYLDGSSYGDIFRGRWSNRTVAVKVMKQLSNSQEEMLRMEIQTLKRLQGCNNVLSFYGYSVKEGRHIVVMELAENGNLMGYLGNSDKSLDKQVKDERPEIDSLIERFFAETEEADMISDVGEVTFAGLMDKLKLLKPEKFKASLRESSGELIAHVLQDNPTLTQLDLSYNKISTEGIKAIALSLRENTTLSKLNLGYSEAYYEITAEGGIAIAQALRENTTLTHLDLQCNEISDEGGIAIAQALQVNTTLTHLNLQQRIRV